MTEYEVFILEKYRILLPDSVQEREEKVSTPDGITTIYIKEARSFNHHYMVCHNDYPQHVVDANFPEKMLDGARDGMIANVHGQLLSETIIDFHGYEGREVHVKLPQYLALKSRLILIHHRLYQLQVLSKPNHIHSKETSRFFDSFEVEGVGKT